MRDTKGAASLRACCRVFLADEGADMRGWLAVGCLPKDDAAYRLQRFVLECMPEADSDIFAEPWAVEGYAAFCDALRELILQELIRCAGEPTKETP